MFILYKLFVHFLIFLILFNATFVFSELSENIASLLTISVSFDKSLFLFFIFLSFF